MTDREMLKNQDYGSIKYAEKDSAPKLSDTKTYFGSYRGVRFEIKETDHIDSFTKQPKKSWCHYIILNLDEQLEKEVADKFWLEPQQNPFMKGPSYSYNEGLVGELEFHGGCTYYSKESKVDDTRRIVKIGCDYQHLWDEGMRYTVESVYLEVKQTIESLYSLVGDVKFRSWGDGKYRYLKDFTQPKQAGEVT